MSDKHLKSHQYYSDLYDRGTVEQCRRTEKNCDEMSLSEDKKFKKEELENMRSGIKRLYLYAQTGERYQKKSETIRAWMDADTKLDELLEHAQPPEDIRCLTCRNRVIPTFKELWHGDEKENRVLFMFDCPNKCLPRRAFFNTGEEWRPEPRLCPQCVTKLTITDKDDGLKSVTTLSCSKCGYTKTEEYEWQHKKEEPVDEHFADDRDRFCLTPEKGAEYADSKWRMAGLAKIGEEFKEKEKLREEKLLENPKGFHLEGRATLVLYVTTVLPKETTGMTNGVSNVLSARTPLIKEKSQLHWRRIKKVGTPNMTLNVHLVLKLQQYESG